MLTAASSIIPLVPENIKIISKIKTSEFKVDRDILTLNKIYNVMEYGIALWNKTDTVFVIVKDCDTNKEYKVRAYTNLEILIKNKISIQPTTFNFVITGYCYNVNRNRDITVELK